MQQQNFYNKRTKKEKEKELRKKIMKRSNLENLIKTKVKKIGAM